MGSANALAGGQPVAGVPNRVGETMSVNDFSNQDSKSGLSVKLWRGERMCLVGMDVD
jgi:hypothetical protein